MTKDRNVVKVTLTREERDGLDEYILRIGSTLPESLGTFTSERVIKQALREYLKARGIPVPEP